MDWLQSKNFAKAVWVLLLLTIIFIGQKVSFIFHPFVVIMNLFFIPFSFAMIFYYMFVPAVDWLEKKKIKRIWGVSLLYLGILLLVILSSLIMGGSLQRQFIRLASYIPTLAEDLRRVFSSLQQHPWFARFQDADFILVERFSQNLSVFLENLLTRAGSDLSSLFSFFSATIMGIVLLPVFLFFMLLEAGDFRKKVTGLFKSRGRDRAEKIITEIDAGLNSFIQGRIIVSLFVGIVSYIGFIIIGIDAPLILAMIIFVTNFIPYVGPIIGSIPALVIALLVSLPMAFKVLILIVIVQQVESLVVSPIVMSKTMSMHPVIVLVVVILGGQFAGILGIIFAVPAYVIAKILILNLWPEIQLQTAKKPKE